MVNNVISVQTPSFSPNNIFDYKMTMETPKFKCNFDNKARLFSITIFENK